MKIETSDILDDIDNGKCVLIIGPDLHDFSPKSFFEVMCDEFFADDQSNEVMENITSGKVSSSQYVFLNEELIQPKPGARNETKVRTMMKKFYQKQHVFNEAFNKIAMIPFDLIISLMPDDRLVQVFENENLPYNFGYYPVEEIREELTEKPNKEKPLIYNILGSFEKSDAVISFESMFNFLSNIMKNGLPLVVNRKLSDANTIIFLGVHFERWHAQLLLKIISPPKGISYNISNSRHSHDVSLFVSHRLQVDLLDQSPELFLNALYAACEERHEISLKGEKGFLKTRKKVSAVASVFISYSHADMEIAKRLANILEKRGISVMIDENDMNGGQPIADFMENIKDVDFVIPLISESSLYKPFVFKEIMITMSRKKQMIPCCLDQKLFDNSIQKMHMDLIDNQITTVNGIIGESKDANVDHLMRERSLWTEYKQNFPVVIKKLREIKCRTFNGDTEQLVSFIVQDINAYQSQHD